MHPDPQCHRRRTSYSQMHLLPAHRIDKTTAPIIDNRRARIKPHINMVREIPDQVRESLWQRHHHGGFLDQLLDQSAVREMRLLPLRHE